MKKSFLFLTIILFTACVFGEVKDDAESRPNSNLDNSKVDNVDPDVDVDVEPQSKYKIPAGVESKFATAEDGTKIHYLALGSGVPVVLTHGYYANADLNWFRNGLAQELAKTNRVIALDLRGHGLSDKPYDEKAYGDNMWKDVLMVMDQLNLNKFHIHGYSMGGSIITKILYHAPERILTATYGGAGVPTFNTDDKINIEPDAFPDAAAQQEEEMAQEILVNGFEHDQFAMLLVSQNAPWSGFEHKEIDLTKIDIPVLAINGEFDTPNQKTARMKKDLPNFQSIVLKQKSHLSAVTEGLMPPLYKKTLVQFIKDNNYTNKIELED